MAVVFWVTTNCNLNCKYCYEGNDKPNFTINKEVIDLSLDFISKKIRKNQENIVFPIHGGEPLLHFENMKLIVEACKNRFKDSSITFPFTTNGTILNDEILDFIINEVPDVTLSIDGGKYTQDNMRRFKNGESTYEIVLKNGKRLLEHLPNMRVRMTFDSDTVNNLYEDIKFLVEQGFKIIVPAPNIFDQNWDYMHLNILENQMIKIKKYIELKEDVLVSLVDKDLYINKGPCNGGINNFSIYPNGKIYPCTMVAGNEEFCIGNVYRGIDYDKLNYLLAHSNCKNKECRECGLNSYCSGERCKMLNKLITGDYYSPPAMECAMQRLKYKINFLSK